MDRNIPVLFSKNVEQKETRGARNHRFCNENYALSTKHLTVHLFESNRFSRGEAIC